MGVGGDAMTTVTYEAEREVLDMIDGLKFLNRAYQALYALGETPSTVETLSLDEARMWIQVVQDVVDGDRSTYARRKLAELNPVMLRYITTGKMMEGK